MISSVVDANSLNEGTNMILVNCIYFKGTWQLTFPKNATRQGNFFLDNTTSVKVDFMNLKNRFRFGIFRELNFASVVSLPYRDSGMSMMLVLPENKTGLPDLLSVMHKVDWSTVDEQLGMETVNVTIPKFNASFDELLNEHLKDVRMEIFQNH